MIHVHVSFEFDESETIGGGDELQARADQLRVKYRAQLDELLSFPGHPIHTRVEVHLRSGPMIRISRD